MLALTAVAIFWGAAYAIIKDALNTLRPFQLISLRFVFSTILLLIIFFPRIKKITKKDFIIGLKIGVFLFLGFVCMIIGINNTTASKQAFLIGTYVLIVPFLGWTINKRKPGKYSTISAIIAVIGIGFLTISNTLGINSGDLISILCSFFFAIHMIMIERYSSVCDPIISTIVQFGITAFLFVVLTLLFESYNIRYTTHIVLSLSYIIVFSTVIAFLVQNIAQKYISATSTALILSMETAFGGIFSVLLLHDVITARMLFGGVLILFAIVTQETKLSFINIKKLKG